MRSHLTCTGLTVRPSWSLYGRLSHKGDIVIVTSCHVGNKVLSYSETEWLIDCDCDWLIEWLIDCDCDWLIEWLIDCDCDWLIGWLIDCDCDWLIGWLIDCDWLADWVTVWPTDEIITCVAKYVYVSQSVRVQNLRKWAGAPSQFNQEARHTVIRATHFTRPPPLLVFVIWKLVSCVLFTSWWRFCHVDVLLSGEHTILTSRELT